ncbi:hypothetical protein A2U01_0014679 [Trifolium medium]|uniref:Uncharacterized protein n=1 Tax=Trifolium medium TaxID=97028 RepID=A0A392N1P4_9FABA|nr:hypothetical protein [Trifolium medium]
MAEVNYQRRNNQHGVETVELVQGRVLRGKQSNSVRRHTMVQSCVHGLETEAVMMRALNDGYNGLVMQAVIENSAAHECAREVSDYLGLGLQFPSKVRLEGGEISGCNKCKSE